MKKIYILIACFLITLVTGSVIIVDLKRHIDALEGNVLATHSVKESVVESTQGEKGEQGERGLTGAMPEGHWEAYCIYPENEQGYRSQGAMIRKSSGDCNSSWRVVEIWEK